MKILAIGNSFSVDSLRYFYQISEALGEKPDVGNLFIGGCSVERHVTNARENLAEYVYYVNDSGEWSKTPEYRLGDALRLKDWDVVTMQQASGYSGLPESYADLDELISYARSLAPHAKFYWNMTWAYQADSHHKHFPFYHNDQMEMYRKITETVNSVVLPKGVFTDVIPTGTAVQNLRTSFVGDTLTRDGFHLSLDLGRYLAGLTWARVLYGKSVEGISYVPEGVSEEQKIAAARAAEAAVRTKYEVTKID